MKKLLVFGLDGATFSVLQPYVQEHRGGLFDQLISNGYVSVLKSTLPYFTAPAWATFMTGLEPGQHGLYHWRGRYDEMKAERPLLSSAHLTEATFWWYCQLHGCRVSISNFPLQYPAPPTEGRYICGTLAPEDAPGVTWPPELRNNLYEVIPDYRFEINKGLSYVDKPDELREHILQVGKNHARALELFGAMNSVDLLVHVVTITDRMQHFFWHCFDQLHPAYDDSPRLIVGNPIFEAYSLAETLLKHVWDEQNWENVIILSDHGMGPSTISFQADVWLSEKGYTVFANDGRVDINQCYAYSGEEPECCIYINQSKFDQIPGGRQGIPNLLEKLRNDLLSLTIPGTNSPAFSQVFTKSELYSGIAATLGPDLVLVPSCGVHPRPGKATHVFEPITRLYAGHRPEGIFIGYGC